MRTAILQGCIVVCAVFCALLLPSLAAAQLATYPALHLFTESDGSFAGGGLILGNDGNLYGVTGSGGAHGLGTVFRISLAGSVTTLHAFSGTDGSYPYTHLLQGSDGALYGVTEFGGIGFSGLLASGNGEVYRITTGGSFTVLHQFADGSEGHDPRGGLIQASNGGLYGTTYGGGSNGCGTVYAVSTDGSFFQVQHDFTSAEGIGPVGRLAQIHLRNSQNIYLFGATAGDYNTSHGTIFRLYIDKFSVANNSLSTLHTYTGNSGYSGPNGSEPMGSLILGSDGAIYGVAHTGGTLAGGGFGYGTVFKMSVDGSSYTTLYTFTAGLDGEDPIGGLIQASDGRLYGITSDDGGSAPGDYGTVYRISTDGTGFSTLHRFVQAEGYQPTGELVQAGDGNIYGDNAAGGNGYGSVFAIDLVPPSVTASCTPGSIPAGNRNSTVIATVSGVMSDQLSGVDTSSGTYTLRDSAGGTTPGTFAINANGSYSFALTLSAYTAKRTTRTYTFTISGKDKQGNASSATTTLAVIG